MVARRLYKLFRFVLFRVRTSGRRNLSRRGPFILVSNHVGSFGPITVMTSLPVTLHPWVTHEVTEVDAAAERIRREFVEAELGLRPPLSRWVARVVGRICVALMRDIGAVPVHDRSRRIARTVDESLDLLERGHNILVFPENAASPVTGVLHDFCTGFIHLARRYYERTRRAVAFLPIAVHPGARAIKVGEPLEYDVTIPFPTEKLRLKRELAARIEGMYRELDRPGSGA